MTPRKIDARLVARAAEGDNEAFERLERRHKNEQAMWLAVVALAIARDENAYTLIYLHHKPVVWKCACKTLRKYADVGEFDHQAEAEEALQRTFSKAFGGLSKYDGKAKLRTWLWSICRNDCVDWLRKKRTNPYVDLPELSAEEQDQEAIMDLMDALERLCDVEREAFTLVFVHGFSQIEAARVVGVPRTTLCSRLQKASEHVRAGCREPPMRELRAPATRTGARDAEFCGLYHSPPRNAIVISLDEICAEAQARQQPKTQPASLPEIGDLLALGAPQGEILTLGGRMRDCPGLIAFLEQLELQTPPDKRFIAILDSHSGRGDTEIWLARHPRWRLHDLGSHSDWLEVVGTLMPTIKSGIARLDRADSFAWIKTEEHAT